MNSDLNGRKLVYVDDICRYIKTEINPYGKPFKGSAYEFGLKIMEYIENTSVAYDVDKALNICAEVISKLPGLCERICPIGCDYGTEESCKDSWKLYLEEQLKEGVKDVEKHEKKTKYDQIRSMCVEEMASFLSEVKYDGIYYKEGMEYPIISEVWKEWLQSEVEE